MNKNVKSIKIEEPDEKSLAMTRVKKRSILISLAYRLGRAGDAVFGRRRMLRLFLNGSWLFWRFAFERSGAVHGDAFHNHCKALSEDYLKGWITPGNTVIDIGCGLGR